MCAASFTKSFLDLEGELTPILVSLVSKDQQAHSMLDSSGVKLSKTIQVWTIAKALLLFLDAVSFFALSISIVSTA